MAAPVSYPQKVTRGRRRGRGRHARPVATLSGLATELVVGTVLLGAAGVAGVAFVHRPWPNRLDVAGFAALAPEPSSRLWHDVAALGSLPVLLGGIAVCVLSSLWKDRARALACVLGPGAAVFVIERIAKPLVGRHVTALGGNSYPSGTVTAVAALVIVAALVAPIALKPFVSLVGLLAILAVSAAVIAMRWHFPTDTLGGAAVGAGSVLALDAGLHLPGVLRSRRRRRGRPGVVPPSGGRSHQGRRDLDGVRAS